MDDNERRNDDDDCRTRQRDGETVSEGRKDSDGLTGRMDRHRTWTIEKSVPPDRSGRAVDNTQNGDTDRDGGKARKAPTEEQLKSSQSGRTTPE